jgi:hypothetical protein
MPQKIYFMDLDKKVKHQLSQVVIKNAHLNSTSRPAMHISRIFLIYNIKTHIRRRIGL